MPIEVHIDTALPVFHEPPDGLLATTATAVLYKASSTALETLTVTLPTAGSATISGGSTADALIVSSASGMTVGHKWRVTSDGVRYVFTIARVDGTTIYPLESLPLVPDTGSAIEPIRMTATIAAPGESELGDNLRLEWLYDDGSVEGFGSDAVSIVRWKWNTPITAARIRQHLAYAFPATIKSRSGLYWQRIASEASDRIRSDLLSTGRRAHLYGDPDVFRDAGLACARWLLSMEGITPAGSNPGIYLEQMRADYDRELARAISSLNSYDADGDGAISAKEARGLWFSVGTSR